MSYSKKDLVNFRIHKAKATFQDALLLVDTGRWDSAANRLYYAGYYMISAYLAEREIKTTTHTGVKTKFNEELIKTGKIDRELGIAFNQLFSMRQDADYEDFEEISESEVRPMTTQVQKLLNELEMLLILEK
jgi:uncharacterized protein (UPF0332 family)